MWLKFYSFVLVILVLVMFKIGILSASETIFERLFNTSCEYRCFQTNKSMDSCPCNNEDVTFLESSKENVQFLCRESNFMVFYVKNLYTRKYFVEVQSPPNTTWKEITTEIAQKNNLIKIKLEANTEYKFRFWFVAENGSIYKPIETKSMRTLNSQNISPLKINAIELSNYFYNETENKYKANIKWTPSTDKNCHYEIVWFEEEAISDYNQVEVKVPENFTYTLNNLLFNSSYTVGIMAKSSDWQKESEKVWLNFKTPHCHEVFASLEFCVPLKPSNLLVSETLLNSQKLLYNVSVSWEKPKLQPDFYTLHLSSLSEDSDDFFTLNITGNATKAIFKEITLQLHYEVIVYAHSIMGKSDAAIVYKQIDTAKLIEKISKEDLKPTTGLFINIFVAIVLISLGGFLIYYKFFKWNDKKTLSRSCVEENFLQAHYITEPNVSNKDEDDLWEINASGVILENELGQGAFGVVKKGWLLLKNNDKIPVAIKMLQENPKLDEQKEFQQELDIMKSVGIHPNIVSLIGFYKDERRHLNLVVEFCAKGNLLNYLRNAWEVMTAMQHSFDYENISAENFASNKLYLMQNTPENECLQLEDLISIARQVALGMEYLSGLHVLHRDLAARNVLVCEDGTVKVSDFGLSRDVYRDDVYCKTSCGKLPIRWLALESLTHQIYTTHSDVWSYGILLWEILTLGGNPYPGIPTQEILNLLLKGHRMDCPPNCSPELYSIMASCWLSNPTDRPTFTQIRESLDFILDSVN